MLSQKFKKEFGLSEVSTLTPADASGPTIWLTDVGIHKIDGPTLIPFNMVQAIKSKKRLTWSFYPTADEALSISIWRFIQGSNKIRQFLPHTPWPRMRSTKSSENSSLSANMAEDNEVIGGGEQLVD